MTLENMQKVQTPDGFAINSACVPPSPREKSAALAVVLVLFIQSDTVNSVRGDCRLT